MLYGVYSVYDSGVKMYMQPFYSVSKGNALRSFITASNDPNMPFFATPSDYTLFQVGEWDDVAGIHTSLAVPLSLGTALMHKHIPQVIEPTQLTSVGGKG